jgi:outer membrane lipoprotein-sorting protein
MGRLFSFLALAAGVVAGSEIPPIHQVSARMAEARARAATQIRSYTVLRRYTLKTGDGAHFAQMVVRLTYTWPGQKTFEVLSEDGSTVIQKRVFQRLLKAEEDSYRHDVRMTPENYDFHPEGVETVDGHECYVLGLTPKGSGKYLIRGRIWVDSTDYAIVRVEGDPVELGSFWIKRTHLVQKYQNVDGFWLPAHNESDSDVRIFGTAHLRVESFDYKIERAHTEDQAGLRRQQEVE